MPTRQATSDRALATLNKFCRQELLGAGEAGSGQVFQRGMQEHERSGGYAQAGATHERCAGPDGTPIDAAA
jgi:hypothetical protein